MADCGKENMVFNLDGANEFKTVTQFETVKNLPVSCGTLAEKDTNKPMAHTLEELTPKSAKSLAKFLNQVASQNF